MDYNITYRQKNNGIQAIISYKDNTGKWKQKSKQGFENSRVGKKKAKEWVAFILKDLEDSINVADEFIDITFKEYYDLYIKHVDKVYSKATHDLYERTMKYFKDISDIELKNLKNIHIQNCVDDMYLKKLSNGSIYTYLCKINAILNSAVENDIINKNPCKVKVKVKKPDKTALTTFELEKLLNIVKNIDIHYYIACMLASKCGLRRGEILGLTWDNIKPDYIKVDKQWKQNKDKSWGFGTLKTNNSYREVPISNNIYKDLMYYKREFKTIDFNNRLLPYITNTPLSKTLPNIFRKHGFDISFHELRHTYATIMIMQGLDFKTVADLIGDDVTQLNKTYSHVTDEMRNKARETIKNIF
ncbi:site-specific integrase [Clostridium culturomicium]|uniref:site-specific integrase n=1 Tax=Clostridium culturomicium TaxID=1499683 RepID=UPI00058F5750|nr:tyrosine-type recombinase/integrase [Clostridium culturomicium]